MNFSALKFVNPFNQTKIHRKHDQRRIREEIEGECMKNQEENELNVMMILKESFISNFASNKPVAREYS